VGLCYDPDSVYLSGMLANFGKLALGHNFPADMDDIIRIADFDEQICEQSRRVGIHEWEAAGLVALRWHLPGIPRCVMQNANNEHYTGDHWELVLLVGYILRYVRMMESGRPEPCARLIRALGVGEAELNRILGIIPDMHDELRALGNHLAGQGNA
jgi:HD-like signal output (HDOD) protein